MKAVIYYGAFTGMLYLKQAFSRGERALTFSELSASPPPEAFAAPRDFQLNPQPRHFPVDFNAIFWRSD